MAFVLPIPNYLPTPFFRSVGHFQPTSRNHEHTFNTARPISKATLLKAMLDRSLRQRQGNAGT